MLFTLQRYEFFSKSQRSQYHHLLHRDVVYPTKVRIFQQITTEADGIDDNLSMLFTLQRYEFFSKSQLHTLDILDSLWCCLPYKGTNFSANHNLNWDDMAGWIDVVYPTKVRIFQQITTNQKLFYCANRMLFTLQRYEFFSKSQQDAIEKYQYIRCCLPYKGTNFSANHNLKLIQVFLMFDVVYPTKVRIFQQITTLDSF